MNLVIDPVLCQGHGQCVAVAPAVLELGSDDLARLRIAGEVPEEEEAAVELAIALCPEAALCWARPGDE